MIRIVKKGKRTEYDEVRGRIVMARGMAHWESFSHPHKVIADEGRFVIAARLETYFADGQWFSSDDVRDDDRARIDKRSIGLVCDTAAEANLVRASQEEASRSFNALIAAQAERIKALDGVSIDSPTPMPKDRIAR